MESTRIATADKHTLADVVATGCPAATLAPTFDRATAPDTATANRFADVSTRLEEFALATANAGRVAVVEASELPTAPLAALTGFVTVAETDEPAVAAATAVDGLLVAAEAIDPPPARAIADAGRVTAAAHNDPDAAKHAASAACAVITWLGSGRRRLRSDGRRRIKVGIYYLLFFNPKRDTEGNRIGWGGLESHH